MNIFHYHWILLICQLIHIIYAIPNQIYRNKRDNIVVVDEDDIIVKEEGYGSYRTILNVNKNKSFTNAVGEDIVSISSTGDTDTGSSANNNNNGGSQNSESASATLQHSEISFTDEGFKESLGLFELYIYNKLLQSCNKKLPDFKITLNLTEDGFYVDYKVIKSSIISAFISFIYDHTDFWWVYSYRYSCEYLSKSGQVISIELDLCWSNDFCDRYSANDIKDMNELLASKKKEFIEEIGDTERKTSYQILRNIHDLLIGHTTLTNESDEDLFSTTIYGALVLEKATSEGIAKTFKYFSDYYKIINMMAIGYGYQWNFVKMNEKWYAVDVTRDATKSTEDEICYNLFLIGYNDISDEEYHISYINDITYNLVDRVKTTSNSLTHINYPQINKNDFFTTNGISKQDIFESTVISVSSQSTYDSEVKPDPTNERLTTLISTFTTTVITVIQGNLDLDALNEKIIEEHKCDTEDLTVSSINKNYESLNKNVVVNSGNTKNKSKPISIGNEAQNMNKEEEEEDESGAISFFRVFLHSYHLSTLYIISLILIIYPYIL